MNTKKIVVFGGGTGTYTVLSGLKKYPNLDISVVVSMMDDGGSNRVIRDEFGLLPTSDLRQCIVALASNNSDKILRKLFTYRYSSGTGISGMTFGNLFMAALTDLYNGDQKKAIKDTCDIFGVTGKIIPVTYEKTNLIATYSNGKQVLGEHAIDELGLTSDKIRITNLSVIPEVKVNKEVLVAIKEADMIVLGPGDFYTSILPNIIIDSVSQAIKKSKAKLVYVVNLMTKFGQTTDYKASDFLSELDKYVGKDRVDYCLINNYYKLPNESFNKYKVEKAKIVEDDLIDKNLKVKIIRKNLVSTIIHEKSSSDKLTRSLIRHDPNALAKAILEI